MFVSLNFEPMNDDFRLLKSQFELVRVVQMSSQSEVISEDSYAYHSQFLEMGFQREEGYVTDEINLDVRDEENPQYSFQWERAQGVSVGILGLPKEVISLLLRHLSVFDVSRLSRTCKHFQQFVSRADIKLALYRMLPFMGPCGGMPGTSRAQRIAREALVITGDDARVQKTGLRMALEPWSRHFRTLIISSSEVSDIDKHLLAECISRMEVVMIEGASLNLDAIQTIFSKTVAAGVVRVLILVDQRNMLHVGNSNLRRLATQMNYLVLPYPGSMIDGIAQDQLLEILSHVGRLKKLILVTYWELGEAVLDFEIACLLAHFHTRRRIFQRSMARIQTFFGMLQNIRGDSTVFPQVELVSILKIGSEVNTALCYMWSNPIAPYLDQSQCKSQLIDLRVPDDLSEQLSLMGWTRVVSAESVREEWMCLGNSFSGGAVPPANQHEDTWNPSYSCAAFSMFLPLP